MVWGCGVISGAACHTSGFHSTSHLHTHKNKSIRQICQEQFPDSKNPIQLCLVCMLTDIRNWLKCSKWHTACIKSKLYSTILDRLQRVDWYCKILQGLYKLTHCYWTLGLFAVFRGSKLQCHFIVIMLLFQMCVVMLCLNA